MIPDTDSSKYINKKVHIKRKSVIPNKHLSLYAFNSFDEFCEFCTYMDTSSLSNLNKKLKSSALYLYNSKYYLALHNINLSLKGFKSLHCAITEFSSYIIDSEIFERKLIEHGKTIIEKNAIGICIKHFG